MENDEDASKNLKKPKTQDKKDDMDDINLDERYIEANKALQ